MIDQGSNMVKKHSITHAVFDFCMVGPMVGSLIAMAFMLLGIFLQGNTKDISDIFVIPIFSYFLGFFPALLSGFLFASLAKLFSIERKINLIMVGAFSGLIIIFLVILLVYGSRHTLLTEAGSMLGGSLLWGSLPASVCAWVYWWRCF